MPLIKKGSNIMKKKNKKRKIIMLVVTVLIVIVAGIKMLYTNHLISTYNNAVNQYNTVLNDYNSVSEEIKSHNPAEAKKKHLSIKYLFSDSSIINPKWRAK